MRIRDALMLGVVGCAIGACSSSSPRTESARTDQGRAQRVPIQRFVAERTPWTYLGREGWEYHTPSAVVRTTVRDRAMLIRLPSFIELSQAHARHAIAPLANPQERITTYMLGTRAEWESLTQRLLGEHAGVYLAMERGGFAAGTVGVYRDIGPKDSFTIAAHEGWHQFANAALTDKLPVWLDEGIACYIEGFRWSEADPDTPDFRPWANLERYDQLRRAASSGTLMSLHTLVNTRPQDHMRTDKGADRVLTYYAQLWALVHFFRERGYSTGLSRALVLAQDGRLLESMPDRDQRILRSQRVGSGILGVIAPGVSLRELDEEYQRSITEIVRVGSRQRILEGRSPFDP